MAMQEAGPAPSAQVVGNAFVEQYYHILHQSPGLVHRFYQDSSSLSRPDTNGVMTTVSTMQVSLFGTFSIYMQITNSLLVYEIIAPFSIRNIFFMLVSSRK